MSAAFVYSVIGVAVLVLLVVGGVLRGRKARHEDGDRVFEDWYTERSGPPGGAR